MRYEHIVTGRFIERLNRFVARVELAGKIETVHVKNTGRCRELLLEGVRVYLEKSSNPSRSTAFDLVAVEKEGRIINMDSQAPNKTVEEWLRSGGLFPDITLVRPETKYGNSRFDFYVETGQDKIFIEVKGVTLEEDSVVSFPDAPSARAVKHVGELIAAKHEGFRIFVMFVIQMEDVRYFTPNRDTHPAFAKALCEAADAGVEILAYDCRVTPESMTINRPVPIVLEESVLNKQESMANNTMAYDGSSGSPFEKSLDNVKETLSLEPLFSISRPLLLWYDRNRRILPWREEPTPYRVWVSEIMLQQTRVEAVKPYFERFMKALPNIAALADAPEEALLKLWEGLGYYNRVRNLKEAARQIQETYNGRMPDTYEELLKLKGIGSYTAGAVASIAFGRVVPAVDGNVLRVVARLRVDNRQVTEQKVKISVEQDLEKVMPADRPGDFNQAMMELGACVCLPNGGPLCAECPLSGLCLAHKYGVEKEYPKKAEKKPRRIEERTILIVRDENKVVIRKRPEKGLLAGMYELPSLSGRRTAEEITAYLAKSGIKTLRVQPLEDTKHIFTHREWHMKAYMVRVDELEHGQSGEEVRDWIYIEPEETRERYPIPSAFEAYTKYLSIRLGKERF